MYALIEGQLEDPGPPTIVLVGGIGYELWLPERDRLALPPVGDEVRLHTHLQVREDEMTLFGFSTSLERSIFRSLISVNGVGPRVALAVLGDPDADEVLSAVARGDSKPLLRVKGIGRKTAERIVLELEDKAAIWSPTEGKASFTVDGVPETTDSTTQEAALVLESMGLSPERARSAVAAARQLRESSPSDIPVENLVREALRYVQPPA